jgi:hypothetical protein
LLEPLPDDVYAGAPYLMKVPSGEVILSYQTTSGRTTDWERSTLEMAIGDKTGRNFTKLSRPFQVPLDREAKWNSISSWDENTVVAAATTSFQSPNCEVWIIKGHIIPELKAVAGNIQVDGNINEWGADFPIFIGNRGETNLRASVWYDESKLYICANVSDKELVSGVDGIYLYLDADHLSLTTPATGLFRIWCNYKGEIKIEEGDSGTWKETSTGNIKAIVNSTTGSGYCVEFEVPFAELRKVDLLDMRINLGLVESSVAGATYEENIANSTASSSNTWCRLRFE